MQQFRYKDRGFGAGKSEAWTVGEALKGRIPGIKGYAIQSLVTSAQWICFSTQPVTKYATDNVLVYSRRRSIRILVGSTACSIWGAVNIRDGSHTCYAVRLLNR